MAILKCKMCGGDLKVEEGINVCECEYCGSKQTVPNVDNEKKITLFTRANRLRTSCEFDKAFGVYESIVSEFPEEAEAYWGLILCKYGIEYVDDPATGKKIPTCHRSSFESIFEDSDFEMVMEYSDVSSRSVYRSEAKAIEELRTNILEVSSKEEPYDIFICYKETDENGDRTIDSVLAQDVYDALTEKGYKVFFSRITLEDKLGQEYEPYIFAALNSAKVMLAFGTNYEYYNAVWVKNEWSRYLGLIAKGEKKTLIPCYKDIDAYDMPVEFKRLQGQDMGKIGAVQDLLRGIGKIIGEKKIVTNQSLSEESAMGALTLRGYLCLEDGDVKTANEFFERALDANAQDAKAYLGKVLAFYGVKSLDELKECKNAHEVEKLPDFRHALRFCKGSDEQELQMFCEYLRSEKIQEEKQRLKLEEQKKAYNKAIEERNQKIQTQITKEKEHILAVAEEKRKQIEQIMMIKNIEKRDEIKRLNDERALLEKKRVALGVFAGKQKEALAMRIIEMDRQIRLVSETPDRQKEYRQQLNKISEEVKCEMENIKVRVESMYPMPVFEEFKVE